MTHYMPRRGKILTPGEITAALYAPTPIVRDRYGELIEPEPEPEPVEPEPEPSPTSEPTPTSEPVTTPAIYTRVFGPPALSAAEIRRRRRERDIRRAALRLEAAVDAEIRRGAGR